ncbi:ComEA family DNA-binding protein [Apilactobacillus ozensis]|uniref:ComEA family DNA-binding protein n=1 Tax=Apilactobacillus ozensis TaxID=866801 RepID=UPI00200AFB87|nr:ComEA family DNA-binding protein [Apilactobacillus ozensis]MCK8607322.1 ComEA family DNA-binding protein [Apilactobacillus ozensis]
MANKFDDFINLIFHTKLKYGIFTLIAILISGIIYFKDFGSSSNIDKSNNYSIDSNQISSNSEITNNSVSHESLQSNVVYVDIKGQVKKPGVYKLSATLRVDDAIRLAGGFTKDANRNNVNLAQKLTDQMVILVEDEDDSRVSSNSNIAGKSSDKININTADANQLTSISGIGDKKANKIIDYRNQNGLFSSLDDLKNVDGFGDKTVEKLKEYLFT